MPSDIIVKAKRLQIFYALFFLRVLLEFHSQLPFTGFHLLPPFFFKLKYFVYILYDLEKVYILVYAT